MHDPNWDKENAMSDPSPAPQQSRARIFLVVVDETEEMHVALRYAALRASHTGGKVALLSVIEPPGVQISKGVEDLMEEERREEAEQLIARLSADVQATCGTMPIVHIREGRRRDELLALIAEQPSITVLVLAAGAGQEGPGPLITALIGRPGQLRIPITIVPGGLTDDQIATLA
jgi:nucleotide-binding universal stress UspA family protein